MVLALSRLKWSLTNLILITSSLLIVPLLPFGYILFNIEKDGSLGGHILISFCGNPLIVLYIHITCKKI